MKIGLGLALLAASGLAAATEQGGNASSAAASCIEVEVNGERAPSFACLTQKMSPTAAPRPPAGSKLASEAIVERPPNQLGLFNRSATSQRMGNTFGNSVYSQRPEKHTTASPMIPRTLP